MNRNRMQCKHFVQHYFINESLRLSGIYKSGHCNKSMIKDRKLKICKEWTKTDDRCNKLREKHKLESVIQRIHTELDEVILIHNRINEELETLK